MRFDGKKPIEFTDETVELEQANLEETKYVLKGSAPSSDSSFEEEPLEEPAGEEEVDLDFEEPAEEPVDDKPFDGEPFDAGVEADEDTDPEKYIQQLSGKLGQSLRKHSDEMGQPDFDLEKFAVNSVLSATHTSEMDAEDQKDIIKKVKTSGKGDDIEGEEDADVEVDKDVDIDVEGGEEDLDFGEEGMEEHHDMSYTDYGKYDRDEYILKGKDIDEGDENWGPDDKFGKDDQWESYLKESRKNGIFVKKDKVIEKLRLMENTEPAIVPETKPVTKPAVKPARPMRETDRPFLPKRKVKPDPKASEGSDIISDEETK